jgi:hypothetical protein
LENAPGGAATILSLFDFPEEDWLKSLKTDLRTPNVNTGKADSDSRWVFMAAHPLLPLLTTPMRSLWLFLQRAQYVSSTQECAVSEAILENDPWILVNQGHYVDNTLHKHTRKAKCSVLQMGSTTQDARYASTLRGLQSHEESSSFAYAFRIASMVLTIPYTNNIEHRNLNRDSSGVSGSVNRKECTMCSRRREIQDPEDFIQVACWWCRQGGSDSALNGMLPEIAKVFECAKEVIFAIAPIKHTSTINTSTIPVSTIHTHDKCTALAIGLVAAIERGDSILCNPHKDNALKRHFSTGYLPREREHSSRYLMANGMSRTTAKRIRNIVKLFIAEL